MSAAGAAEANAHVRFGSQADILSQLSRCLLLTHMRHRFRRNPISGNYGTARGDARDQTGLMPANLITLAHFSVSSAMNLPNSAGDPGSTVLPRSATQFVRMGVHKVWKR